MLGVTVVAACIVAVLLLQSLLTGIEVIDIDLSASAVRTAVQQLTGLPFTGLLATFGYMAVLILVGVESIGIPVPGETMLLVAAIYAGTTHRLSLPLVILSAATGAILGDNVGFVIGRSGGYRLLRRYGPTLRLNERRLKLGQYLFWRHGGKVVFLGRFVAVLRVWAAFLAGTTRMPWTRFLVFNTAGGIVWATAYGLGGYFLGHSVHALTGPIGLATVVVAVLALGTAFVFVRRNEQRLEDEAVRALPGPFGSPPPIAPSLPLSPQRR